MGAENINCAVSAIYALEEGRVLFWYYIQSPHLNEGGTDGKEKAIHHEAEELDSEEGKSRKSQFSS